MALTAPPPLADLVRSELKQLIISGKAPVGSRLPERGGPLRSVQREPHHPSRGGSGPRPGGIRRSSAGIGNVRHPPARAPELPRDSNFSDTEYLARAGIRAGKKVLSARSVPADEETAQALHLEEGTRVVEVRRLRTADGHPAVYSVDAARRPRRGQRRPAVVQRLALQSRREGHYVDHGEAIVAARRRRP